MSKVADALARAGMLRSSRTSLPAVEPADLFPPERVPLEGPPPVVQESRAEAVPRSPAAPRPATADKWTGRPTIRYRTAFKEDVVEKLVIAEGATAGVAEEFRKLAATLHHAQGVHQLKVIMVTSACSGEGKSLTTVNLALTLSNSYRRRVLLIDVDLRKPMLHEMFQVQNGAGLLSILKQEAESPLGIEVSSRLMLMPSGGVSADPVGLLTSPAFAELLKDASQDFDWVLLDTPPAALLPDCNLLAPSADGVLLVVDAFHTPHTLALQAIDAVGRDRVLGVVLNHAEIKPSKYTYGSEY